MTTSSNRSLGAVTLLILVYLLFPVVVVTFISFSSSSALSFPPASYSMRWYLNIWGDPEWRDALRVTIAVGGLTTAFSLLIGVPAAIAISRTGSKLVSSVFALIVAALIAPAIIKAISTYLFFVPLGLTNTIPGLAIAHTVSSLPFVVINVLIGLQHYDWNLNRAAIIHGAHPVYAFWRVTLRSIMPSVVVGALFAFLSSAQELLVSLFILGNIVKPLSVKLWEGVLLEVNPSLAAASTSIIGFALIILLVLNVVRHTAQNSKMSTLSKEW